MKRDDARPRACPDCAGRRFAIVVARFYADLAEDLSMAPGARCATATSPMRTLPSYDVPGCFEIPLACRNLIETDRFDAFVALGAVIRGETPHFDFVAGQCARGIMDVQLATGTPIGFGVLTTDTLDQAEERADPERGDKGYAAALAAATLLRLRALPPAGVRRN